MNLTEIAALVATCVLGLLAIFQLALVFGAPIGKYAWGGQHSVLPRNLRIGSVISIILYCLFAAIILDKAGIVDVIASKPIVGVGIWVLTVYFFIGIFMNVISRSKLERAVMTPVAAILAVTSVIVTSG